MIKAIIIDCFGVLYIDPGLGFYQREVKDFAQLRTQILDIDKQYDYGFIDDVEHDTAVAELTELEYDFIHANVRGAHTKNEALLDYMQKLRPQYKLGMLSNIGRGGMESFFSTNEQQQLFDNVVLSSDVGVIKPSLEIYQIAAEKLGVGVDECVMIDDRMANVEGANLAGMKGILFETNRQCVQELEYILEAERA